MKKLDIIAIGDSYTQGCIGVFYYTPFPVPYFADKPYPERLEYMMNQYLEERKSDTRVKITNKGESGELIGKMITRIYDDVIEFKPHSAIVMSGTNDIGMGFSPRDVMKNLKTAHVMLKKNDIQTILCTPPPNSFPESTREITKLKNMMEKYSLKEDIPFIDAFTPLAMKKRRKIFSSDYVVQEKYLCSTDGLHLNEEGYQRVAEIIFEEIKDLFE